jgi:hypothetical protein
MIDINLKFIENLTTCNSLDLMLVTMGASIFIIGGYYTGYYTLTYSYKIISSLFKSGISAESLIQSIKTDIADMSSCAALSGTKCRYASDPILKNLDLLLQSPDLLTSDVLIELTELSQLTHNSCEIVKDDFVYFRLEQEKNEANYSLDNVTLIKNAFTSFIETREKLAHINKKVNIRNDFYDLPESTHSKNLCSDFYKIPDSYSTELLHRKDLKLENNSEFLNFNFDFSQCLNSINDLFFIILNSSMFHTICIGFFVITNFIILSNKILLFYPSVFYNFIKFKKYWNK